MRITVDNVSYAVDGKQLLHPVCLDLAPASTHVMLGPNGAGKSTLLKIVSGYYKPATGSVQCDRRSMHELPRRERAQQVGVLTQRHELDFPFTVRQVVSMGRSPHDVAARSAEITEMILQRLNLGPDQIYTNLSGGERQLVQLGRVFAQVWDGGEDATLLLDEPMTALDLKHQGQVVQLLGEFRDRGTSQLIVMHDINLAAEIADHVTLMSNGSLIDSGDPEQVLTVENLEKTFSTPMLAVSAGVGKFFKANLE